VELNPQYTNIFAINPDGSVWVAAKPFVVSTDLSDRRYFKNALTSGQFSAGEYVFSRAIANKRFSISPIPTAMHQAGLSAS